ncbi:MAG TPA: MBL fold metallo-hydrolase [Bacteroidales bacterium]|jgi:7,8-dihydropterin-6-yl-methyl-4-(beta-D-ribofuranosyl)aminobenzene 5'-phosphate synthase|nr:MBL fold metallo-hydrolase [Bacteroidales bacterium]
MQLTVLTDNCAGAGFLAEHGLSYLIDDKGQKVLFDTGHTDVFLKNAIKLEIDIQKEVNTVVLSHGHWDHGNGLSHLKGKQLITHPMAFMERFRGNDNSYIGLGLTKDEIVDRYDLITTREPYKIADNIYYLGEIPRQTEFESKTTPFVDKSRQPDYVPDDSAICMVQNDELIVISGCAHSGICNTILHAQKVTGISKVKAVIGGFHLKANNKQTKETIHFLKNQNIENVFPSHCTELDALAAFWKEFNISQVKTGAIVKF